MSRVPLERAAAQLSTQAPWSYPSGPRPSGWGKGFSSGPSASLERKSPRPSKKGGTSVAGVPGSRSPARGLGRRWKAALHAAVQDLSATARAPDLTLVSWSAGRSTAFSAVRGKVRIRAPGGARLSYTPVRGRVECAWARDARSGGGRPRYRDVAPAGLGGWLGARACYRDAGPTCDGQPLPCAAGCVWVAGQAQAVRLHRKGEIEGVLTHGLCYGWRRIPTPCALTTT